MLELEVSIGRAGAGVDVETWWFGPVEELLILRFWKAFLMPWLEEAFAAERIDDDAATADDEEACLQMCWLGARCDGQNDAEH